MVPLTESCWAPASSACAQFSSANAFGEGRGITAPPLGARQKWTIGMIRIATMLATLIIGLIAGPAVSL